MSSIHLGTSGWAYPSWKPEFYPPKTPAAKFLSYYATQLNCVEVNYTFRAWPSARMLNGWTAATPAGFRFAVKAHQRITHIKRLKDVADDVAGFRKALEPLAAAGKLGPVLFQLPPFLKRDDDRLRGFLQVLPGEMRAAIEFRNVSWFDAAVFAMLREHDVALCVAESDELQVPEVITASFVYYRFRRASYSPEDVKQLEARLHKASAQAEVFAFLKHEETPEGAIHAREMLRRLVVEQPRKAA